MSARRRQFQGILQDWADGWLRENVDPDDLKLIPQAKRDLFDGPHNDDGYPGFVSATATLMQVLDAAPRELFVDLDSGLVTDVEPDTDDGGEWWRADRDAIVGAFVGRELAAFVD